MPNLLESLDKTHWQTFRFDEIARNISERVEPGATNLAVYVGLEHIDSSSLHIKRTGVPSDVEGTKLRVYAGDVIFGRRRAYQRKAAVATFDGICSAHALVLRAKPDVIDPRLFPFFLHSDAFMHRAVDISVGGLSPTINWGNLKLEKFLLPPLDQQARLAELLWAGDEVSESYSALKNGLDGIQNLLIEHHAGERDYKQRKLEEVIVQKKRVSNSPHKLPKYVGLEQIEPGAFTCESYIDSSLAIANCFEFDKGDVLYSKLRPYLDKAFMADFQAVCTTELLVLNTTDECLPEYLLLILHSTAFINYVDSKSFGTKMPRVSMEIVGEYLAHLPSIDEQREIVAAMTKIHEELDRLGLATVAGKATQQQLINQIFSA